MEVKENTQSRFEGNWKDQATNLSWGNSSLFSSRLGAQKNNRVSEFKIKNLSPKFKRESPSDQATAFRIGKSVSFTLCPWMYLGPKVFETALAYGNIPKWNFSGGKSLQRLAAKFLQWQRVKIAHYCRVHHFKVFRFQRFFSLSRIKLVLN